MPTVIDDHIEGTAVRRDFGQKLPVSLIADENSNVVFLVLTARGIDIDAGNL